MGILGKIRPVNILLCGGQPGFAEDLADILPKKRFHLKQMDDTAVCALKGWGNGAGGDRPHALAEARIIIVDISNDRKEGLLLCRALSGPLSLLDVPVVAMVRENDFDTVELALAAGASDFIMQPLRGRFIAQRLEVLVRHADAHAALRQSALDATGQSALGHDPLTGLPGADLFRKLAENKLEKAWAEARGLALMLVNLDHFRRVQSILGKEDSNQLLARAADIIETAVYEFWDRAGCELPRREDIVVGRHGLDEFLISLPETGRNEDITDLANLILSRISKPEDSPVLPPHIKAYLTARIGITVFPADGLDITTLIKNVEQVTHHDNRQDRSSFRFYTPEMRSTASRRFALEAELAQAMRRGDLKIHYQPEVDIRSGRISGAEALVRWQHPELGMLVPEAFIAVAEDVGLISEIGDWVLQQASLQCAEWHRAGYEFMRVSINISPYQFSRLNMHDLVGRALADAHLPPQSLILEMTESLIIEDVEKTLTAMRDLKNMGVRLALDDFGTGYSSLSYLHSLSVDFLKIDRAFVKELPSHPGGLAVTEAIIRMARALGLGLTAEGVENQAQLDCLNNLGCDYYQGYYFSPPLPAAQVTALLAASGRERRRAVKSIN